MINISLIYSFSSDFLSSARDENTEKNRFGKNKKIVSVIFRLWVLVIYHQTFSYLSISFLRPTVWYQLIWFRRRLLYSYFQFYISFVTVILILSVIYQYYHSYPQTLIILTVRFTASVLYQLVWGYRICISSPQTYLQTISCISASSPCQLCISKPWRSVKYQLSPNSEVLYQLPHKRLSLIRNNS